MSKVFGISGYVARGRRIFPLMLALAACLIWISAAHAQEAPFNSQYDPPPTTPPECVNDNGDNGGNGGGNDSGASGSSGSDEAGSGENSGAPNGACDDSQVLSNTEGPIDVLPTTGGLIVAPILLGMATIVAAGIFTVRRKR